MSIILPIEHKCVNNYFTEIDAELRLIDSLPFDFRRRLIEIAADRCRKAGHGLPQQMPDVATLRRAMDRPRLPDGWIAASKAMERATTRGPIWKPATPSPKLQAWYDFEIDGFFNYLNQRNAWEAVAVWHPLATGAAAFMAAMCPAEGSPAHPRSRGCRLMARTDDANQMAETLAEERKAIQQIMADLSPETALTPDMLRQRDPKYWRRILKKEAMAARQYWQWALGAACAGGKEYCADFTFQSWQERRAAGKAFALAHQAQAPDGTVVSLARIKDAHERGRLVALYAQTQGMEAMADRFGLVPLFLTLTLPGRFHPHPTSKTFLDREWTPREGPRTAWTRLQGDWALLRAHLHNHGVDTFGLRVAEPHKDGCPHLHALIWVRPSDVMTVYRCMAGIFPERPRRKNGAGRPIPDQPIRDGSGRPVVQAKLVIIRDRKGAPRIRKEKDGAGVPLDEDRRRQMAVARAKRNLPDAATPTSYVMKYILTTVADVAVDEAEAAGFRASDKASSANRVRAQMSEMGVRRFALVGMHGYQKIWQRVYAANDDLLATMPERARRAHEKMMEASEAAAQSKQHKSEGRPDDSRRFRREAGEQWANAIQEMGALKTFGGEDGDAGRLRGSYEEALTEYGDMCRRWIGFHDDATGEEWVAPRWTIRPAKNVDRINGANVLTVSDNYPRGAATSDPPPPQSGPPRPPPNCLSTPQLTLAEIRALNLNGRAAQASIGTVADNLSQLPF